MAYEIERKIEPFSILILAIFLLLDITCARVATRDLMLKHTKKEMRKMTVVAFFFPMR